jgi:LysR family transcriptional regulator for metE and metH
MMKTLEAFVDLEVRHLLLVSAVAEHRTLTKAGEALHLTQSALSHQLRDIETRLGTRLFHRLNRRMIPTPAGEQLVKSAHAVLAELRTTEDAIRSGLGARPIPLRLSTECYTCYHWLPAVLRPFRERFPQIEVRIDAGSTTNPLAALLEGRLDVAIMSSAVKDVRLVTRLLFEDEQVAIVAPEHPLADRPFLRLQDFRKQRLISYSTRDESHFATRVLQPAGALPASIEPVQLTEAMIELVKAGHGIAVLARWAVEPHVRSGSLRALRITAEGYRKVWHAVMPKHLASADYLDAFLRLLVAHAPTHVRPAVLPFPRRRSARA